MDRRLALKQLAIITGGAILVPSCDFSEESVLAAYEKLQITDRDKDLLSHVVRIILPGVELKSAEEIGVPDFVLVMVNDCLGGEDQKRFMAGLKKLNGFAKKTSNKAFEKLGQAEAEEFLIGLINGETDQEGGKNQESSDWKDVRYFVNTTKRFTLQGYMTSEYYMTEVMPYSLVPGGFKGEKLIDKTERINTNG